MSGALAAGGHPIYGGVLLIVTLAGAGFILRRIVDKPRLELFGRPCPPARAGRLARENTIRNPSRTATTASALMIGVGLVVFVAVFVNGFKDSFLGALDRSVTSDLIIQPDNFDSGMPREAVSAAGAVPGVQVSTGIQITEAKIGHGGTDEINGIDPTLRQVYTFTWQKGGSDTLLGQFTGDEALIEEQFAKSHHLEIGDTLQRSRASRAPPSISRWSASTRTRR